MFPYWLLFSYFAAGALLQSNPQAGVREARPLLLLGGLLMALMIGLRYEIGGDWGPYAQMFTLAGYVSLDTLLGRGDPGYLLLNWIIQQFGGTLWQVNLICGGIFTWGLIALARAQPLPWLAVLIAVPYLVIVVAMGYSRQAVAIGILMIGLARLERGGSATVFVFYVVGAALFHKTAICVFPLVILSARHGKLLNVFLVVAMTYSLYDLFLAGSSDSLVKSYIVARYASQGAAIRVTMSLVPAILFLLSQRRFGLPERQRKIWRNFSLISLFFMVLLLVLPSSAAVDRLALYTAPLQIVILSRLPIAYRSRHLVMLIIILYSAAVQFVWLNYAANRSSWVPYRSYLTSD